MGGQDPAGQISPDGAWRWDGRQWVPTGQPPAGSSRPGSRAWIWWLGGGCAVLLIVAIAGGIWATATLVHNIQTGGLSCLPSDFPKYTSATVTGENTYVGTGLPAGDSRKCQMSFDTNDDAATVNAFYSSQLATGDWTITNNDPTNGVIEFASVSRPQTKGTIQVLGRGQHTTIQVTLYS